MEKRLVADEKLQMLTRYCKQLEGRINELESTIVSTGSDTVVVQLLEGKAVEFENRLKNLENVAQRIVSTCIDDESLELVRCGTFTFGLGTDGSLSDLHLGRNGQERNGTLRIVKHGADGANIDETRLIRLNEHAEALAARLERYMNNGAAKRAVSRDVQEAERHHKEVIAQFNRLLSRLGEVDVKLNDNATGRTGSCSIGNQEWHHDDFTNDVNALPGAPVIFHATEKGKAKIAEGIPYPPEKKELDALAAVPLSDHEAMHAQCQADLRAVETAFAKFRADAEARICQLEKQVQAAQAQDTEQEASSQANEASLQSLAVSETTIVASPVFSSVHVPLETAIKSGPTGPATPSTLTPRSLTVPLAAAVKAPSRVVGSVLLPSALQRSMNLPAGPASMQSAHLLQSANVQKPMSHRSPGIDGSTSLLSPRSPRVNGSPSIVPHRELPLWSSPAGSLRAPAGSIRAALPVRSTNPDNVFPAAFTRNYVPTQNFPQANQGFQLGHGIRA